MGRGVVLEAQVMKDLSQQQQLFIGSINLYKGQQKIINFPMALVTVCFTVLQVRRERPGVEMSV